MAEWRSVHVYRWHGQDDLLLDVLGPHLARFFYLRYWRGGPHLRLRVPPESFEPLRAAVLEHVSRHPALPRVESPGADAAQRELARLEDSDPIPLVPQDTVREEPYEPEYAKYSGPEGVAIAEELFHTSSLIALDAVRAFRENPRSRIVVALDMLLAGIKVSEEDTSEFLAGYHRFWSSYAPEQSGWAGQFEANAAAVTQVVERSPVGPLAHRWAEAVADAWGRLGAREPDVQRRRLLLLNYLHTHNNRMGVTPMHEAYLGYLGLRAPVGRPV